MRKLVVFGLFFLVSNVFGQVTQNPKTDKRSEKNAKITKVTLTDEYTIVNASYYQPTIDDEIDKVIKENHPDLSPGEREYAYGYYYKRLSNSSPTISINPKSYLVASNGKRFRYIKSEGLPELPDELNSKRGKTYSYTIYFERVTKGIEKIDLIEGNNNTGDTRHYWNYYGIHINNPAENATLAAKPVEKEENILLTVRGKVFDSQTNKPIAAKIVCITDKSNKRIDSLNTPTSGSYLFELQPDAYTYQISADGYETLEESLDLSKVGRSQQFPKNFTLNPINKKPEAPKPVEQPKEETKEPEASPVKIEENKFRLDKVFFDLGESNILPESYPQLDGLVAMMKEKPSMTIRVEGYTDNVGDPDQNRKLSLDRAYNVREYLISKGIAGKRIQFKGMGEANPISANDTEEGRKQNRRVEFVIVNE
ncbi:MAG: OmpA family protein [Spirosomaceae bacterium]|jgi:outer membrane protein OmpA-like peptidoglycan-associated protein|nr:OmpA family protein [Spirosomataceae bacterium]